MEGLTERIVARPRENPTLKETLAAIEPNRCYMVADLVAEFGEYDPPRSTIRNRLETLTDEGRLEKQKHANGRVTYRRVQSE